MVTCKNSRILVEQLQNHSTFLLFDMVVDSSAMKTACYMSSLSNTQSTNTYQFEDDCLLRCCTVQSGWNYLHIRATQCLHHQGDE
jgi:hypothetical protein